MKKLTLQGTVFQVFQRHTRSLCALLFTDNLLFCHGFPMSFVFENIQIQHTQDQSLFLHDHLT